MLLIRSDGTEISPTEDAFGVMTPKIHSALLRFREFCLSGILNDLDEETDYYDMSLGYLLALGLNIDEATSAALWARYEGQYWTPI